nr:MAG TPA: hypothetical protein [Bacteriophage sp.]
MAAGEDNTRRREKAPLSPSANNNAIVTLEPQA